MTDYYCPNCDLLIASCSGTIDHLRAVCQSCKAVLNYDFQNKNLVDVSPPQMTLKIKQAAFGRDKLKISDMFHTQEEALKANHSHYFTGKPCRNGHIAPRTKRGECNQCVRDSARRTLDKRKISPRSKRKMKSWIHLLKKSQKNR